MTFNADKHWKMVLDTPGLTPIAYAIAAEYFKRHSLPGKVNPTAFTIPIEDEETEAAFRAYMAESTRAAREQAVDTEIDNGINANAAARDTTMLAWSTSEVKEEPESPPG